MLIRNVRTIQIPCLHPQVDLNDVNEKGYLLSDDEIRVIKNHLAFKPAGFYSKHTLNRELRLSRKLPFGIMILREPEPKLETQLNVDNTGIVSTTISTVDNGRFFVVYRGKNRGQVKDKKGDWYIGQGGTGKIKLIQEMDTGKWFALKVISNTDYLVKSVEFDADGRAHIYLKDTKPLELWYQDLQRENENLKTINQHVGHTLTRQSSKRIATKGYVVMNLLPGVMLADYLEKEISVLERLNIGLQMLYRINELNNKDILHCDIKPDNMVYDKSTQQLKLVDWYSLGKMDPVTKIYMQELWGTPQFMPPEHLKIHEANDRNPWVHIYPFSHKTEAYSVAASLKALFHMPITYSKILNKGDAAAPPVKSYLIGKANELSENKEIQGLLDRMMENDPDKRLLIRDAIPLFEKLVSKYTPQNQLKKVALFDFADFNALYRDAGDLVQENIIKKLSLFDEICFITKDDEITHQYLVNMRLLMKENNLPHFNSIIITQTPLSLTRVPEIIDIQNHKVSRHYTFINFKDAARARIDSTANTVKIYNPEVQLRLLLKGINTIDFEYDQTLSQFEHELNQSVFTVNPDLLRDLRIKLLEISVEYKNKVVQDNFDDSLTFSEKIKNTEIAEKWENMRADVDDFVENVRIISTEKLFNLLNAWIKANQVPNALAVLPTVRSISATSSPKSSYLLANFFKSSSSLSRVMSPPTSNSSSQSNSSREKNTIEERKSFTPSK